MKTITKEVHYCDFCKKSYLSKSSCARHEKMCNNNPDTKRPCFECEHLDYKSVSAFSKFYGDDMKYKVLFCQAKKVCLFPPKVEVKGNALDIESHLNMPMPKSCDLLKSIVEPLFNFDL